MCYTTLISVTLKLERKKQAVIALPEEKFSSSRVLGEQEVMSHRSSRYDADQGLLKSEFDTI